MGTRGWGRPVPQCNLMVGLGGSFSFGGHTATSTEARQLSELVLGGVEPSPESGPTKERSQNLGGAFLPRGQQPGPLLPGPD